MVAFGITWTDHMDELPVGGDITTCRSSPYGTFEREIVAGELLAASSHYGCASTRAPGAPVAPGFAPAPSSA